MHLHLPRDLWQEIFWYYTPKALANLALVSREWNEMVSHHPLWKNLLSTPRSSTTSIPSNKEDPNNNNNYYDNNHSASSLIPRIVALDGRREKSAKRQYCLSNYEFSIWKKQNGVALLGSGVKLGMYLCINGRPCRVVEMRKSKPGRAKAFLS